MRQLAILFNCVLVAPDDAQPFYTEGSAAYFYLKDLQKENTINRNLFSLIKKTYVYFNCN